MGALNERLQGASYSVEANRQRLQAVSDLNRDLGTSYTCAEALDGLANTVYQLLQPKKIILYCVDDKNHRVFGSVRDGQSGAQEFSISAAKGAPKEIGGLESDRDALVHVVHELAGKLSPETGLVSLVAGRLFFTPFVVGQSQRAGMLVEASTGRSLEEIAE